VWCGVSVYSNTETAWVESVSDLLYWYPRDVWYHSLLTSLSSSLLSKSTKITIYRTVTLSVVLYGCETWSLTLREEHRLRQFENSVLRRIFEPNWGKITGDWRKLHNEELNILCSSPNTIWVIKSRRMRWAGHVARMGREEALHTGF